ncbi:MAG: UDP-3-O-(3-hydroxymyristoyl)glucosamine N-acyltransferase [Chloroflexota bacterium]
MIELTAGEIARALDCEVKGTASARIVNLNRIEHARSGDITFYSDEKFREYFDNSQATCIIVPKEIGNEPAEGRAFIISENPYLSFVRLLKILDEQINSDSRVGIMPSAQVSEDAIVGEGAFIGHNCIVSRGCVIGNGARLLGAVYLAENVIIGDGTILHPNVVCYRDIKIGKNCIVHAGAVIGADGFGYVEQKSDGSWEKIPQLGDVIIGDEVELGANVTVDRAMLGSTIIENGVKIDNLTHIAHNCEIGENTAMAAQTGISGSSKIGKRNRFGGQVGLAGHLSTPDDVTIMAQSGVAKSVPKSGVYFGTPIKDHRTAFRIEACIKQLPDMFEELNAMKKKLREAGLI